MYSYDPEKADACIKSLKFLIFKNIYAKKTSLRAH